MSIDVKEHRLSVFESITNETSPTCDTESEDSRKVWKGVETTFSPLKPRKMFSSISKTPLGAAASFDSMSECSLETTV